LSITIKDIARLAGVSHTTVARALNGQPGVSEETRARIVELAQRLRYQSNALARGLVTRRSQSIGLLVPDMANPFYVQVAKGIEQVAVEAHYSLVICDSDHDQQKEIRYVRFLREKQVDGMLVIPLQQEKQHFVELCLDGFPLVFIDCYFPDLPVAGVVSDNYGGARQAVEHLIRLGYRRIAFLVGTRGGYAAAERLRAYCDVLKAAGFPVREEYVLETRGGYADGYRRAQDLLQLSPLPEAVLAANDMVALGVMRYFAERGVRIPDQIALVGFDDIDFAGMLPVPLTTVRQHPLEIGHKAAELLLDLVEGRRERQASAEAVIFPTELVVRSSCGVHRGAPRG
jgi:LacI family transcriptional regulator